MKEQLRAFEERPAEVVFHWHDAETEAKGWVVINSFEGEPLVAVQECVLGLQKMKSFR